jgi:gamma-tubulin complex component 4
MSNYEIDHDMLPRYIALRIAEKILFVGEALQIFTGKESSAFSLTQSKGATTSQLHSHQLVFSSLLADLQKLTTFDLRLFESCCNQIKSTVAENLWLLLVKEANLIGSLQTLKEFFLLGRGELFLTFIDTASSFMNQPPTNATQHDVNVAFKQSLSKLSIEYDNLLSQLHLTVPTPPKKPLQSQRPSHVIETSWDVLGIEFKPKWPLHILFTQSVLDNYNKLFKILLVIRRAQVVLNHTWRVHMSKRVGSTGLLWQLRLLMAFFIDNLQYYVQVDVLETQFAILMGKIRGTHDFESIRHAHDVYLNTLLTQLFSRLTPVWKSIKEILHLCHRFHSLVETAAVIGSLSENDTTQLEMIAKDFSRHASLLFHILSNVKSYSSSPHLAQLLLRVDFNQYFTTHPSSLITLTPS